MEPISRIDPASPAGGGPGALARLFERAAPATARLRLSPLEPSDAAEIELLTSDPAITAAVSFLPYPFSRADAAALIARNGGDRECFLGVRRRADAALVGVAGAHLAGEAEVEIGYWIGLAFQNKGYATEAVTLLVATLDRCIPDRRPFAECRPDNAASWAVLAKLGFRATGEPGARPERVRLSRPGRATSPVG
jgi:RimJ/RimL family protein N-acetyltransferase